MSKSRQPADYKTMVRAGWATYASERTPKNAIRFLVDQYKLCKQRKGSLTIDETYQGYLDFESENCVKELTSTDLDIYTRYKQLTGKPLGQHVADDILGPEFATNVVWTNGRLRIATIKYLGMELQAGSVMFFDIVSCNGLAIDDHAVELVWNILELELLHSSDILKFLLVTRPEGFLLSTEKVETLTARGVHEKFDDESTQTVEHFLIDVTRVLRKVFRI